LRRPQTLCRRHETVITGEGSGTVTRADTADEIGFIRRVEATGGTWLEGDGDFRLREMRPRQLVFEDLYRFVGRLARRRVDEHPALGGAAALHPQPFDGLARPARERIWRARDRAYDDARARFVFRRPRCAPADELPFDVMRR